MSYLQLDTDHPRSVSKRLLQGIPLGQGLEPRCSYCLFDYPCKQNAGPKRCKNGLVETGSNGYESDRPCPPALTDGTTATVIGRDAQDQYLLMTSRRSAGVNGFHLLIFTTHAQMVKWQTR